MTRIKAFLIHLGISLVIFAALACLVVFVWYPDFFFTSDGGWQGIRIIALVDLVLGPTLTLIVFNVAKPRRELQRDLAIIGLIQFSCLIAGTYVVYSERPLALVYVDGWFHSMSTDDYLDAGVPVPDLQALPGGYPKQVAVKLPEDLAAEAGVRREALQQRTPLRTLSARYVPFTADELQRYAEALPEEWLASWDEATGDLSRWLARYGGERSDYAFFPFGARYAVLVLGVSRGNGDIVGLLETPLERSEVAEAPTADAVSS